MKIQQPLSAPSCYRDLFQSKEEGKVIQTSESQPGIAISDRAKIPDRSQPTV